MGLSLSYWDLISEIEEKFLLIINGLLGITHEPICLAYR